MNVYIIFLTLVMLFCGFRIKNNTLNRYVYPFALLGWIVIIAFSGFRYGVGTDYFSYESIFFSMGTGGSYNESLELGFKFIGSLFSNTQNGFYFFIFILSLITNTAFLVALYRENKNLSCNMKLLGLFLFFLTSTYFWPFNGIRQGIACSFIAFSLKYIFRRELFQFSLCILLAALFHKSAFVVFLIYFLYGIRLPKITFLLVVFAAIIIHQVGVVSVIEKILLPHLGDKYARYIDNPPDFGGSGLGVYVYVVIFIVLWASRCFVKKSKFEHDVASKKIDFYLCLCAIGVVLRVFALDNIIFVRFAYYFTIFDMFFIPYLISQFQRASNRIFLSAFFITVYFVLFVNSILNSNDLLPYESIFFR